MKKSLWGLLEEHFNLVAGVLSGTLLFGSGMLLAKGLEMRSQPLVYQPPKEDVFKPKAVPEVKGEKKEAKDEEKINLNKASEVELESLSGIGPVYAGRIVEYRKKHPFRSVSEIQNIKGIGPMTFAKIKDRICVK